MKKKKIDEKTIEEVVYTLLQLIPVGKVTTYRSLARVTGQHPRKIARILSRNKEIVKIPCHRVVKENRDLSGYSLGREFKRKLLELEGVRIFRNNVSKEDLFHLDKYLLDN